MSHMTEVNIHFDIIKNLQDNFLDDDDVIVMSEQSNISIFFICHNDILMLADHSHTLGGSQTLQAVD